MSEEIRPEWCLRFIRWMNGDELIRFSGSEISEAVSTVKKVLDILTPQEREIIKKSYGLVSSYSYNVGEIAEFLKMKQERVLELEAQALQKIKESGLLVTKSAS